MAAFETKIVYSGTNDLFLKKKKHCAVATPFLISIFFIYLLILILGTYFDRLHQQVFILPVSIDGGVLFLEKIYLTFLSVLFQNNAHIGK